MIRKTICVLFALCLVLGSSAGARAAEESGSIRIQLDAGELPVTEGAVTMYRVGVKTSDGYRIIDTFGGGMVKDADATSPHLAQWLAETQDVYGKQKLLDADGNAVYDNLGQGLYLVVQTQDVQGFHRIKPFLLTMPMEDEWEVRYTQPLSPILPEEALPQTGQDPAPFLGMLGMLLSGAGLVLCQRWKNRCW